MSWAAPWSQGRLRCCRCLLLRQDRCLLLRLDRSLLLRHDRCLLLRQDKCIVLRQGTHLSCLNSRHLSCLSSRHLSCLNSRHLSCLNTRLGQKPLVSIAFFYSPASSATRSTPPGEELDNENPSLALSGKHLLQDDCGTNKISGEV